MNPRLLLILAALASVLLWGTIAKPAMASTEAVKTTLYPGWNLIGWIEEATSVDSVFEELDVVASIHDVGGQSAHRNRTERSGRLARLLPGKGYWFKIESSAPQSWVRSVELKGRRTSLDRGVHAVAWTGWGETSVHNVLAGVSNSINVAWGWNASVQSFMAWAPDSKSPALGPFLLATGDALLLNMNAPATWLQPTGLLPEIEGRHLLDAETLSVVEADIRATEILLTGKFGVPIDQTRVTLKLVADQPRDGRAADPCCPESKDWVRWFRSSDSAGTYEVVMEASNWKDGSWLYPDTGRGGGFNTLIHEYFHILQYELAQSRFDQVPQWLVEGTAIWLWYDLGLALDHGFHLELFSNRLDISAIRNPYPQGHYLGEAYVRELVRQTTPDSYFQFWRHLSHLPQEEGAWEEAFARTFGVSAQAFTDRTNEERRASFALLSGLLVGPGATAGNQLTVAAYTNLPLSWVYHFGDVNQRGEYSITLPRGHDYYLRVGLRETPCAGYLGEGMRLVSEANGMSFEHNEPSPIGPVIRLPQMFCQEQVEVRVDGDQEHVPEGLKLEACDQDGEICTELLLSSDSTYRGVVPIPGAHIVEITSDDHSCKSYMSSNGPTISREAALLIESALSPAPTVLEFDADSQLCSVVIRGRFSGRSADWLEGRTVRAYRSEGGFPFKTELDREGRFELPVSGPGEYEFSLLGGRRIRGELLPCSISSGIAQQWTRRVSNTPINRSYVTVGEDIVTELDWEISPDACRYIVRGHIHTTEGLPVPQMTFVICPGDGYCSDATSDAQGKFEFLVGFAGDVWIEASHMQPRGGVCDFDSQLASKASFIVQPSQDNFFDWMIPPDTCS